MALSGVHAEHTRTALYKHREGSDYSLYGTILQTGTPKSLAYLTEDLTGDKGVVRSSQGKANRLKGPIKEVSKMGTDKNLTMDVGPGDQMTEFLEDALCGTITPALAISATTIGFTSGTNVIDDSANGFGSIKVGTWIRISGATDPANNGDAYVTASAAGAITVQGLTLVTEAAAATVVILGQHIRTGTVLYSSTYERYRSDFSADDYQAIPGGVVNSLTIGFTPQTLFTMSVAINHLGPDAAAGSTAFGGAPSAVESFAVKLADSSNDLSTFRVDGTALTDIQDFSFTLNNNHSFMPVAGALRPAYVSQGAVDLSGSFKGWLIDGATLQDDMFAGTRRRLDFGIIPTVVSGSVDYYFTIHRAFWNGYGDESRDAESGPVSLESSWDYEEDDVTSGLDADVAITVSVLPVP